MVRAPVYPVWLGGDLRRAAALFASRRCCDASESAGLGFLMRSSIILEARTAETSGPLAWSWAGLCCCSSWSLSWCSLDLLI
jgi:hypothetical protein